MKPNVSWMKALLVAVSLGAAVPLAAQNAPAGGGPKTDAGKAAAAPAPKKEPEPKINGIVLTRPKGGYLGLTLDNNNFKLSFYNAKKKPTQVDVALATARWPVHYSAFDERTVLNPNAAGTALTSSKFVRPPYAFKLYLSLFAAGSEQATESYVIDFHQ